jgi:hypothetical protein
MLVPDKRRPVAARFASRGKGKNPGKNQFALYWRLINAGEWHFPDVIATFRRRSRHFAPAANFKKIS